MRLGKYQKYKQQRIKVKRGVIRPLNLFSTWVRNICTLYPNQEFDINYWDVNCIFIYLV